MPEPLRDNTVSLPRQGVFRPRDELLQRLTAWWNERRGGVCALLGGFGSGKSMLADQFLLTLPSQPQRLRFVRCFERGLSAETFCAELFAWLNNDPSGGVMPPVEKMVAALRGAPPALIVLDAAEKALATRIAESTVPEGLLDDLIARAVCGEFPNLYWLLTSRYPPASAVRTSLERYSDESGYDAPAQGPVFEHGESPFYHPVWVGPMSEESCIAMLREGFKIRGSDEELKHVAVTRCGCHPLVVALVGSYLKAYGDRDPKNLPPHTVPMDAVAADDEGPRTEDDARKRYRERTNVITGVVLAFREQMFHRAPAGLALLERLSLFLRPWTAEDLAWAFVGTERYDSSGKYLAKVIDVPKLLGDLKDLGLAERSEGKDGVVRWSAPAYLREILPPTMKEEARRAAHERIAEVMAARLQVVDPQLLRARQDKELLLPRALRRSFHRRTYAFYDAREPGLAKVTQFANLDAALELIGHYIALGRLNEAYNLLASFYEQFEQRHAWEHMRRAVELFFRGSPITAPPPSGLEPKLTAQLVYSWGDAAEDSGHEFAALAAFQRARTLVEGNTELGHRLLVLELHNREITVLAAIGEFKRALERTSALLPQLSDLVNRFHSIALQKLLLDSRVKHAELLYVLGRVGESRHVFGPGEHFTFDNEILRRCGLPRKSLEDAIKGWVLEPDDNGLQTTAIKEAYLRCNCREADVLDRHPEGSIPEPDGSRSAGSRGSTTSLWWYRAELSLARFQRALARGQSHTETPNGEAERTAPAASTEAATRRDEAKTAVETMIQLVRDAGYVHEHQVALHIRARLALLDGQPRDARRDALTALFGLHPVAGGLDPYDSATPRRESDPPEGRLVQPSERDGRPRMLAVTHPDCGDVWGELEHRLVLAEADLMEAAMELGCTEFDWDEVPDLAKPFLESAKATLKQLVERHEELDAQRPEGHAPDPELAHVRQLLADLVGDPNQYPRRGRLPVPPEWNPDAGILVVGPFARLMWRRATEYAPNRAKALALQAWLQVAELSRPEHHARWRETFATDPPVKPFDLVVTKESDRGQYNRVYTLVRELTRRDADRPWDERRGVYGRNGVFDLPQPRSWHYYVWHALETIGDAVRKKKETADNRDPDDVAD